MDNSEEVTKDDESETQKEKQPRKICQFMTLHPYLCFVMLVFIHLCFFGSSVGLYLNGYSILPVKFDTLPIIWHNDITETRYFAWLARNSDHQTMPRFFLSKFRQEKQFYLRYTVELYFHTSEEQGNLFTKETLTKIKAIEEELFAIQDYQNHFCLLNEGYNCTRPYSVLRFFDGTHVEQNSNLYDPAFDNISSVLYHAEKTPELSDLFQYFLSKDSVISRGISQSRYTRILFPVGWPPFHDVGKSDALFKDFLLKKMKPLSDELKKNQTHLKINYYSYELMQHEISEAAHRDIRFIIGSLVFIVLFILFHTRSVWISFSAIFGILSSFVITNMIYRIVFGYIYFGLLHVLSMFIILGIGADDVFIFYDAWRLSEKLKYSSLAVRLSDVYERASTAMLATSLTTMVAFFISAYTPLLIMQSFGIFCGLLVLTNYLTVITLFPCAVIIYHIHFENFSWFSCFRQENNRKRRKTFTFLRQHVSTGNAEATVELVTGRNRSQSSNGTSSAGNENDDNATNVSHISQCKVSNPAAYSSKSSDESYEMCVPDTSTPTTNVEHSSLKTEKKRFFDCAKCIIPTISSPVSQEVSINDYSPKTSCTCCKGDNFWSSFLSGYYLRFISDRSKRWLVLNIFAMLIIISVYQCSKLDVDMRAIRMFRYDNNFETAIKIREDKFRFNFYEDSAPILLIWGIKPNDNSRCNYKNIHDQLCRGNLVLDKEFSLSSNDSQLAMLKLCDDFLNMGNKQLSKLRIKRNGETGLPEINCFMKDLGIFLQKEKKISSVHNFPLKDLERHTQTPPEKLNYSLPRNTGVLVRKYPDNFDPSFPLTSSNMKMLMQYNPHIYQYELSSNVSKWLEIAIGYWITNGYTMVRTNDWFKYAYIIGEMVTPQSKPIDLVPGQYYGTKLKYAAVIINTTINRRLIEYNDGLEYFAEWEDYVSKMNKRMPHGSNHAFHVISNGNVYIFLKMYKTLVSQAVIGICSGLALACPILVIGTMNMYVGLLATLSIAMNTLCVVGMIVILGWKLGVMVSLNLCLVVGLSVDYTVHLAEGYVNAPFTSREGRTKYMLGTVGIPVTAGAVTTLGSSFFMVFAELEFLVQFGTFMFCTIGFSLLFSLGFFSTLMAAIGPANKDGNLTHMIRRK